MDVEFLELLGLGFVLLADGGHARVNLALGAGDALEVAGKLLVHFLEEGTGGGETIVLGEIGTFS